MKIILQKIGRVREKTTFTNNTFIYWYNCIQFMLSDCFIITVLFNPRQTPQSVGEKAVRDKITNTWY